MPRNPENHYISRREFLRLSAASGAAALLGPRMRGILAPEVAHAAEWLPAALSSTRQFVTPWSDSAEVIPANEQQETAPRAEVTEIDTCPEGLENLPDSEYYEIRYGEETYYASSRTLGPEEIGSMYTQRPTVYEEYKPRSAFVGKDQATGPVQVLELTIQDSESEVSYIGTDRQTRSVQKVKRPVRWYFPITVISAEDARHQPQEDLLPDYLRQEPAITATDVLEEDAVVITEGNYPYKLYGQQYSVQPDMKNCLNELVKYMTNMELAMQSSSALADAHNPESVLVEIAATYSQSWAGYYRFNNNSSWWSGKPIEAATFFISTYNKRIGKADTMSTIVHELAHSGNVLHHPETDLKGYPVLPNEGFSVFAEMIWAAAQGTVLADAALRHISSYMHDSNTLYADKGYQLFGLVWWKLNEIYTTGDLVDVLTDFHKLRFEKWQASNYRENILDFIRFIHTHVDAKLPATSVPEAHRDYLLTLLSNSLSSADDSQFPIMPQYAEFLQDQFVDTTEVNKSILNHTDKLLQRIPKSTSSQKDASWCLFGLPTNLTEATMQFYETETTKTTITKDRYGTTSTQEQQLSQSHTSDGTGTAENKETAHSESEHDELLISETYDAKPTQRITEKLPVEVWVTAPGVEPILVAVDNDGQVELTQVLNSLKSTADIARVLVYNMTEEAESTEYPPILVHVEQKEPVYKQYLPEVRNDS